jgi:hypothetical protein
MRPKRSAEFNDERRCAGAVKKENSFDSSP